MAIAAAIEPLACLGPGLFGPSEAPIVLNQTA